MLYGTTLRNMLSTVASKNVLKTNLGTCNADLILHFFNDHKAFTHYLDSPKSGDNNGFSI